MATWNSRGLRGSGLEEILNMTNEKYRENGLALVQKIPTPITPIRIDKESRQITLAYFEEKSTVDYIGAVQGYPVCFDAKECQSSRFSLQNIHEHQIQYMEEFEKQGGIAFFLLFFKQYEQYYYLPLRDAKAYVEQAKCGGFKHIKYGELNTEYFIPVENHMYVNYLKTIQKDIDARE